MRNRLNLFIILGLFIFISSVNAELYDDFSSGTLNADLWEIRQDPEGQPLMDEYGVLYENDNYLFHTQQNTSEDKRVALVPTHNFTSGDKFEYDVNYLSGSGNRGHIFILTTTEYPQGDYIRAGIIGPGDSGAFDDYGWYHISFGVYDDYLDVRIQHSNGTVINDSIPLSNPDAEYKFYIESWSNGTVHLDYDNFEISQIDYGSLDIQLNYPDNNSTLGNSTITFNWTVFNTNFTYNNSLFNCNIFLDNQINNSSPIIAEENIQITYNISNITSGNHNWSVNCSNNNLYGESELRNFVVSFSTPQLHAIKGYVFESDGVTQVPLGTIVRINATQTGSFKEIQTAGPPGYTGFYATTLNATDNELVIVKAYNSTSYGISSVNMLSSPSITNLNVTLNISDSNCGGPIQCNCNDTLVESQVMWYDLNNCNTNGLIIGSDNLVLDCNNHIIDGIFGYNGIGINGSHLDNITIKNCRINDFYQGMKFDFSSQINLLSNLLTHNRYGLDIINSSNAYLINNTITNSTYDSVNLNYNINVTLFMSNISYNHGGLSLSQSLNGLIINNTLVENTGSDLYVNANSELYCDNTIENNIGSGMREIKYINSAVNLQDETFSELILCNADNSVINNVNIIGSDSLDNNGIIAYFTDNSNFTNINSSFNSNGIMFIHSANDYIANNNFNYNGNGILFEGYDNGLSNYQIINNNVKENTDFDIYMYVNTNIGCENQIENNTGSNNFPIKYFNRQVNLQNEILSELILCNADNSNINNLQIIGSYESQNNGILMMNTNNSIVSNINSSDNNYGILLLSSSNNIFSDNTFINDKLGGLFAFYSFNNVITNNIMINNTGDGVHLSQSSNNSINYNFIKDNVYSGISLVISSSNNTINQNDLINNYNGIEMGGSPAQLTRNNMILNNRFIENSIRGISIGYAINNTIVNNYFINNNINAFAYNYGSNNNWNLTNEGNYWSDFASNVGYPNYYQITGWQNNGIDYHPNFVQYIVDDSDPEFSIFSGNWNSREIVNAYNNETRHNDVGFGLEKAGWRVNNLVYPGTYKVYAWKFEHPYLNLMANNTHYMVYHRTGTSNWIIVNQQASGNEWIYLGEFEFDNSHGQGIMITDEANGRVIADAVKLVYQGPLSNQASRGPELFEDKD